MSRISSRCDSGHENSNGFMWSQDYDANESDSDTSSSSSSSSSSSVDRFSNNNDYYRSRTMSNKGLMINIPNYLSKLSPTPSNTVDDLEAVFQGIETNRGRGKSLSKRIKDNNLKVNSNINKLHDDSRDDLLSRSPIDIPVEFKDIIKSRSNSISRTRTNSISYDNLPVNVSNTGNRTRGNSMRSDTPSLSNLRNIASSLESINSINSQKNSNSSLMSNTNANGHIPMKNLKKYLTTGDEMYLVDDDSDEDLFMNNLSHQQQKKRQYDLMVNMTSSANLYVLNELQESDSEQEIERIKKDTKLVDSSNNMALDKVESIDINMGLNFGSSFSPEVRSEMDFASTLKANNLGEYKKVTPIDLYGDSDKKNEDEKKEENDSPSGSSWFLGGNV